MEMDLETKDWFSLTTYQHQNNVKEKTKQRKPLKDENDIKQYKHMRA